MIVLEFKVYAKSTQFKSIDEAIRITQFIRNKALRQWMDAKNSTNKENATTLYRLSKTLAQQFPFVTPLNSSARQASTERAWNSIKRFYDKTSEFPKFQYDNRSVEFKTSGWELSNNYKNITFKSCNIGKLQLKGSRNLQNYNDSKIQRVRIIKRADGYYCQFSIKQERILKHEFKGKSIGIDVGLNHFYTDSNGVKIENPRYLRKSENTLKRLQRRVSKCKKKSNNRKRARNKLSRKHLKVSRQRKDFAVKIARQVIVNNDFVSIEDLQINNLLKNHKLAKSISDASWGTFIKWLEYFGKISGVTVIKVPPQYTSQKCSKCNNIVKKSLSERTHICSCGCVLDRDENAAVNILASGFRELKDTVGHTGINASGDNNLCNN
jgi:putative transposase